MGLRDLKAVLAGRLETVQIARSCGHLVEVQIYGPHLTWVIPAMRSEAQKRCEACTSADEARAESSGAGLTL